MWGLLVNYKSDFEFCYFAVHFWESFCFTYFKIILHICNVSPLSRTQTSSRKHSEVLELIILWALVIWFVCSAPRGLIIFLVSYMTAGRDSMCYDVDSIPTHQSCWLKIQRWNNSNILFIRSFLQESVRRLKNWLNSRITTTELYILQLPPSLEGGLESQSLKVLFVFVF